MSLSPCRNPRPVETTEKPHHSGWLRDWRESFWRRLIVRSESRPLRFMAATIGLVAVIGAADFLTGFELSMLVFYFVPVALAVACVGWRFGVITALLSVGTWLVGDIAAGAHYRSAFVPVWNAIIALSAYLVVVWLIASVTALQRQMETRVNQRTAALTEEIAERQRLERVILDISERERRSIGRDLHDGLSQHLTGTALVAQALGARLAARQAEEAGEMAQIVALVEQGIEQTRSLAKGLLLAEIERDGLATALQEFAAEISAQFRVACVVEAQDIGPLAETGCATHLYRIAQEATRNSIRHGRARRIRINLRASGRELVLEISDDGAGLPLPEARGQGLGLRIMAHRAAIVGAVFSVQALPGRGTLVQTRLPLPA